MTQIRTIICKTFIIFFESFFLFALSPRLSLHCDFFEKQQVYEDFDGDIILRLKGCIKEDDCLSLQKFQRDYPRQFSLYYAELLRYAVSLRHISMFDSLLEYDAYPMTDSMWVRIARESLEVDCPQILKRVIERYPDLKIPGSSLMHMAVKLADLDAIKMLYHHQKNIEMKDCHGRTPLHYAVLIKERALDFVRYFCDKDVECFI